ncbi:MAG: hypothetical protein R3Y47_02730 [Lachnospiraceae bacterium]
MELAWTRFLDGICTWKAEHAFFLIYLLYFLWIYYDTKQIDNKKWVYYIKASILILVFPVTAVGLLMFYTPFYDWTDLHTILPSVVVVSYILAFLWERLLMRHTARCREYYALACVTLVLLVATNLTSLTTKSEESIQGIPVSVYEVLVALEEVVVAERCTIVADAEIMMYARQYSEAFYPAYGRDLWDLSASSYVEAGYTYEYELYDLMQQEYCDEESIEVLVDLMNAYPGYCYVIPAIWPELEGLDTAFLKDTLTSEYVVYYEYK